MRGRISAFLALQAALLAIGSAGSSPAQRPNPTVEARFVSATGWVRPGHVYPFKVIVTAGGAAAPASVARVVLPHSATFVDASPAPAAGSGRASDPLLFPVSPLAANARKVILVQARAATLVEDPEALWKDLSARATLALATAPRKIISNSTSHGPRVTTLETARYGDRPFPVLMVEYQDVKHCTGVGEPHPECTGNHTAEGLDQAVNSRTSGKSVWQLYQEMSLGQLHPQGTVPTAGKGTVAFDGIGGHRWSNLDPGGTCYGVTIAGTDGTPLYSNRIADGWYVLPGTQGYYGSDVTGHALLGSVSGLPPLSGVDGGCGPPGKLVYDAASAADPDLDYNDFDTDRDGIVDFTMVIFAGDGGNGSTTQTGLSNVWPHSSDLRSYYTSPEGLTGYVTDDQLRDSLERPLWYTDASRTRTTTRNLGDALRAYVRVGPYNVNPEPAQEFISVIAHEYGHSLGLPDFYSTGTRTTFGTWELMAQDHAQFMTVFSRQDLGWIVPREASDGAYSMRESKIDTHEIAWKRPDGTPYRLSGPNVHNADALRVGIPTQPLIDEVVSGTHAWYSGAGNDFGCPTVDGHGLLVGIPEMRQHKSATDLRLELKSLYEIEWDYDYGFVLASTDGGATWTSLPSANGTTTPNAFNPNVNGCLEKWDNGITGVSGDLTIPANPNRVLGEYPEATWIEDSFDLSEFVGADQLLLLFSYSTDPGLAKRGWFIDDLKVTATEGGQPVTLYASDFETSFEATRLFPLGAAGWTRITSGEDAPLDHAYYVEVRDRVSWDFESKGQADRGPITWEPGISIIYTDEQRGYGNIGISAPDPPAQTPVDSMPTPGSDTPNLDDAAFTSARPLFNGCTHVDNYALPDGGDDGTDDDPWKLPAQMSLFVDSLTRLSETGAAPSRAVATIKMDIRPDCKALAPGEPSLSFGAGRANPDPDGSYTLRWTRPKGAVGPDTLQEARTLADLLSDGAEAGLAGWRVSTEGVGVLPWQTTTLKKNSGDSAFVARAVDGAGVAQPAQTIMEAVEPIKVPASGLTTLEFFDWLAGEGDDAVSVEVKDGSKWVGVYQSSRPLGAEEATPLFLEEGFTRHEIDLGSFAGRTIGLRFRYTVGPENRALSSPVFGWHVDDVKILSADWRDVVTTAATSFVRSRLPDGTYHYRVRTAFPFGSKATIAGPWSKAQTSQVKGSKFKQYPPVVVGGTKTTEPRGRAALPATGVAGGILPGLAALATAAVLAVFARRKEP